MNTAIELHDSEVKGVTRADERITCHFSAAHIHKSEGSPAMDAGTGWIQEAQLIFEDAEMSGTLPELPEFVWSGDFRINGKDRSGLITIPLVDGSGVELDMRFDELHSVRIRGERPSLILIGKPGLVEGCKPANTPQAGTL